MTASRSYWWAIGSLPLMAVGALGPWAQSARSRIDGPQDEVVLALALIAAVMLIAFAGSHRRWLAVVPLLAGAAAAVLTGRDMRDTGNIAPHVNAQLATIDWGLYLTVLGSISLLLASMLMVVEPASPHRAQVRRKAFLAQAASFTPYVAVKTDGELYFVPTRDERLRNGPSRLRRQARGAVLARAVNVLEKRGIRTAGTTFVQVGANIGTTTVAAVRRRGFPHAVAIEPEPERFRSLRLNLLANKIGSDVTAIEAAVSDRDDERPTETAETVTLDGLAARGVIDPANVGLLWLDTHGDEAAALAGASVLLGAGVPVVVTVRPLLRSWPGTRARLAELLDGYGEFVELRLGKRRSGDLTALLDSLGKTPSHVLAVPRR